MADDHLRYERLAVGHVVGGLDEVDAARFRSHLVSCRDCRTRVAELRGIASDLVATEREERAGRRGRTEVAERVEEEAPPQARDDVPVRAWPWRVVVVGLLPLVVLGVLAWAVWIRAENNLLQATAGSQAVALSVFAEGQVLDATFAQGVTGIVAVAGQEVAVSVGNLPTPDPDEGIGVHLLGEDGDRVVETRPLTATRLNGDRLLRVLDLPTAVGRDAETLVVTLERIAGSDVGTQLELVRAELPDQSATPSTQPTATVDAVD